MNDDEKVEYLTRINFNYEGKKFDYFRPSQVRDVPLKYRSIRGYFPSLKTYRYPQFKHLKELVLNNESQLERDFIYLLDHDPNCLDLQTQPCSIQYVTVNGREAKLYPDVWALFSNGDQILFEVKPEEKLRKLTKDKNWSKRIEVIRKYCDERGWIYQFITEKRIKCVRLDNIKDLLVSAKHYAPSKIDSNLNNFISTLENVLNDFDLTFSKLINIMSLKLPLEKSEVISLIKYKIYYGHLHIDWNTPLELTKISKEIKSILPVYLLPENELDEQITTNQDKTRVLSDYIKRRYEERIALISPIIDKYGLEAKKAEVRKYCEENNIKFQTTYNWYLAWKKNGKNGLITKKIQHTKSHLKNHLASQMLEDFIKKWNKDEWQTYNEAHEEFEKDCLKRGIPEDKIPSERTLRRWIQVKLPSSEQLGKQKLTTQKNIKRGLGDTYKEGRHPCTMIQIDHTKLDIWLVDAFTKKPLGRPWLTMGIDVFSRSIWGYYLSFEEPSKESVLLAILNGFTRKENLNEWKIFEAQCIKDGFDPSNFKMPCGGFPSCIQVDNGMDFRADLVKEFFMKNNITLEFRPPKVPEYGGFIESSWDTINDGIRGAKLKGRVFSLPKSREPVKRPKFKIPPGYNAKDEAKYTLDWFREWLFGYFVVKYSSDTKARQNHSPNEAWKDGMNGKRYQPFGGAIRFPTIEEHEILKFFSKHKCSSRLNEKGLRYSNILYSSEWLRKARRKGILRDKETYKFRVDRLDIRYAYILNPENFEIMRLDAYKYDGDDRIKKFILRGLGKERGYKSFPISIKMLYDAKDSIGFTDYGRRDRLLIMDKINEKLKNKEKITKREQKFLELTSKTQEGRDTMAEAVKAIQKNAEEEEGEYYEDEYYYEEGNYEEEDDNFDPYEDYTPSLNYEEEEEEDIYETYKPKGLTTSKYPRKEF